MKKLIALCLTFALSLSAFAQSESGQRTTTSTTLGADDLIVVDRDDLEASLRLLAERLSQRERAVGSATNKVQTNNLRLMLLLQLLNARQQVVSQPASVSHIYQSESKTPVVQVEDNKSQLDRIESMLLMSLGRNNNTRPTATPIIRQPATKGKATSSNDSERIARLEAQVAELLAAQRKVDTVYMPSMGEVSQALSGKLVDPIVVSRVDTVYRVDTLDRTRTELADFKRSVFFAVAKSHLDNRSMKTLTEVVRFLSKYPNARVRIVGFASPEGNPERNKQLAEQRMQAVEQALRHAGVRSQVVTEVGGIDEGTANYALARRVDILLIK